MIVPMKKMTALIFYKDYQEFLTNLRELGVVHINTKKNIHLDNESLLAKINLVKSYTSTIKFIAKFKDENAETLSISDGKVLYDKITKYKSTLERLDNKLAAIGKERGSILPWGEYSSELIEKLSSAGARIDFFTCISSKFKEEWIEDYNAIEIDNIAGLIYFITISFDGEQPDVDAELFDKPKRSLQELSEQEVLLRKEREAVIRFFTSASKSLDLLKEAKNDVMQDLEFDTICESSNYKVDNKLIVLEGWLPNDCEKDVVYWIGQKDVYYELENPSVEDNVPIKLKNNKFAKLFEFIGELYSLPKYGEIDLTPFFAPFFVLFFGICLGDAGYGLLFVIGASLYKLKADKKIKPLLSFLQIIGLSTVVMGMMVGTFFGVNLIESDISWLANIKKYMIDTDKLFTVSLVIGVIQVVFGMFLKVANAVKQFGWSAALSTIGWLVLILGGGGVYLMKEMGMEYEIAQYVVLSISGILIFLLNNVKRNVFVNIGSGLWDTYNMVTGLLGDLLSYIRLFALGVSSSVLGLVFNDIAFSLSGDTPVVSQLILVLILVLGHGINIFMSGLGSLVHPMRLTFVEFYKNAGFSGGGKKYSPFKTINN